MNSTGNSNNIDNSPSSNIDNSVSSPADPPLGENAKQQRGDQIGLGRRVSAQSIKQELYNDVTQDALLQKPTIRGKLQGTLNYLTSLVYASDSAAKVDEVSKRQLIDPQEPGPLSELQDQARSLGISENKIEKATESGRLNQIVTLREKTLKHYNIIIENYEVHQNGRLTLKSGTPTSLTADVLQKVIKTALKNDITQEGTVIKKGGVTYLVKKNKDRKLQIAQHSDNVLGRGAFGIVYEVLHVSSGEMMALKIAKPDSVAQTSSSEANRALFREVQNLEIANGGRVHTLGVQPSARVVYPITGQGKATPGYIIPLYSQSLEKLAFSSNLDIHQGITYSKQLFSGLSSVHAARLVHTDIKPDNIGIGNKEAYLADFGVSVSTEKLLGRGVLGVIQWALQSALGNLSLINPEVESFWYPRQDMYLYDDKIKERNEAEAREVLEKSDVCALGRSIYFMFSGGSYYDESRSTQVLIERGVPPNVIDILNSTQESDPFKRPSAQEIASAFEKIQS